jgi:cobalt/nickel transport system permease protein
VVAALERIQPNALRAPAGRSPAFAALGLVAVLLAAGGVVFASSAPDGIERLAMQTGIAAQARTLIATPLKDYQAAWLGSGWTAQAFAGLAGLGLVYGVCVMIGRKR